MVRILFVLFLITSLATSCCEPPFIDDISVCGESVEDLGLPPSCINSTNRKIDREKSFSASFHAYSIKNDDAVRFTLFDQSDNQEIIEEVSGRLEDFGSRVTTTERCQYFLAYTFKLPSTGVWPKNMMLEVVVTNKDSTFELNLEVQPM